MCLHLACSKPGACGFAVQNQLPKAFCSEASPAAAIPSMHDHGVAAIHYAACSGCLLALCYDNALRAYDTESGALRFLQPSENRCMFAAVEVDDMHQEVRCVLQGRHAHVHVVDACMSVCVCDTWHAGDEA